MSSLYLKLDLKKYTLEDEEDKLSFKFSKWDYNLGTKTFSLDNLYLEYDAVDEFVFEKDIKADVDYVEIEDGVVVDYYISNEYAKYLKSDFVLAVEKFIANKDLEDGEYDVKYEYYYDFSDEEFIIDVLEVTSND